VTVNEQEIKNDLYEAVNGEWLKTAKIPDDKPATGLLTFGASKASNFLAFSMCLAASSLL